MDKSSNRRAGDKGENEVIKSVQCPNCGKKLIGLPSNYPLYDVQCSGCSFRAQVKTNSSKPKSIIFGAGWEIMDKVLKAGFMTPPTFVNFKWHKKGKKYQEIRFYPFVPKKHLKKYRLSAKARRANYQMFNYIGMDKLPYFKMYEK
jgi:DNA-directed RNA polymerase subunit RPC12/RpoP